MSNRDVLANIVAGRERRYARVLPLLVGLAALLFAMWPQATQAQQPPLQTCTDEEIRASQRYWFFGQNGAIDFGVSGTTATAFLGSQTSIEGTTVVANTTGQLLFWSNGQTVFDRNSNPMPNGGGLSGNPSATQTVAAFPALGHPGRYFIVTTSTDVGAGANGNLNYSIVDMALNGGLGDVTATKDEPLGDPGTASEALAAVPNADGTGFWVLTYTNNSPNFLAYEFDDSGPTGTVVTSVLPSANFNGYGSINISADLGRIVALTGSFPPVDGPTTVRLLDFDAATGQATEAMSWGLPEGDGTGLRGYSADFSPDGDYIYATKIFNNVTDGGQLYRYRIAGAADGPAVKATEESLGSIGTNGGQVRRAPDGRMYIANHLGDALSVVNDPDDPADPDFVQDGFPLPPGAESRFGLPQMVTGCPLPVPLPEPFPACDARAFHSLSQAGDPASGWYDLDLVTGNLTQLNPALGAAGADGDIFVNAIGYNVLDDRVYGIELSPGFGSTGYIIVIGGDNVGQRIGPVPGLAVDVGLITGDVSPDGFLYATTSGAGNPTVYVIDVDPNSPDFLTIARTFDRVDSSGTNGGLSIGPDWVYRPNDNMLYSVRANNELVRIHPDTGEITLLGTLTLPNGQPLPDDGGMGGMFLDAAGFLYGYRNANGRIYRIDIDAGTATLFVATGFEVAGNDGARCPNAPLPIDFGDAPDSYGTLLESNGARHGVPGYDTGANTAPLMLGANIDIEVDGQPSANADADNFDDGVVFNPALGLPDNILVTQAGEENTVVVEVVGEGLLSAWIDLNHNGTFDPEDQIFTDVPVSDGENVLTFTVPDTVPHGPTYARFRLSTQSGLGPTGPAPDGEVEDYLVYVAAPAPLTCDAGLINSGFELPNVHGDTLFLQEFSGGNIKIYHENVVPGWSFTASDPNASTGAPVPPEDQRNSIELWRTGAAYEGEQFAEINAYVFGFLYQDMVTIPGTTLSWQFAHRGRQGEDTIGLRIGPPGATTTVTEQTTGNIAWQLYGGDYVVPDGQYITRFEFVAVDTADGNQAAGNFLDAIAFGLLCDPELVATKRASLQVDADGDGVASPGDTLRYTVVISNTGLGDAINTVYADTPDANTTIVPGSVTTSQGTVASETPEIRVELGNVAPDGVVTIVYDVTINNPLPADVTEVSNQGLVSVENPNVPDVPTEDPETPKPEDPTIVIVDARPILSATKQASLAVDADGDGAPSPGDTLLYTVRITNSGNGGAADVAYTDIPDANTSLVVGSVTTSQGAVATGNSGGDATIAVDIGALDGGGGEVEITYQVVIDNPLAAGVTEVANQGIVTTPDPDVPDVPTNDPNTPECCDPTEVPVDARPRVDAYKTATLHVDADGNGSPSPGDTLRYAITIINSGNRATAARSFTDLPDANTSLVVGSVTTTQGNVTSGNSGGDTTVAVEIGSIPGGGGEVVITYEVTIHDPLPAGVTEITNQGIVSSEDPDEPEIPTDDPNTPGCCDPTDVPVDARPRVDAYKRATLFEDADGSGTPSPGDTMLYNITIINAGNQDSVHRWFFDTPDPNTSLVVGSVGTSQGAVVTGNNDGDTTIAVDIGSIPGGGGEVTISFRVVIDNPLPAGVTEIVNQGIVTSDDPDEPDVPTSDPNTPDCCDPTKTPVDTIPRIDAYKSAHLYEDADGNGSPSPGDTLLYTIRVVNSGNQAATGLIFTDTLDAHTSLVVGSVATNRGAIIQGNEEGDAAVGVDIGTLPGGGAEAIITFRVVIDDPLPAEVTKIVNQGVVTSNDPRVPDTLTSDPRTPDCCDPTEVPVDARPRLRAYKSVTLLEDADGSGAPSPGDTLLYEITIINIGNQTAGGLIFTDSPDPNTSLVAGSVGSTRGAVTGGNSPGDTSVTVNIGALPGGGAQAIITFRVVINDPLPAGVTEIVNQGVVSSDDPAVDDILTDDPTTPQVGDPTSTHVEASPRITAYKQADLFFDAYDSDGASAGDTLLYTIRIFNVGNATAPDLVFSDTLDPNTTLLAGTVRSNRGAIVTGNSVGDTSIEVAIGDLPPREGATITFRVLVNDPLPGDLTELVNQGIVGSSSPDIPDVPTSDPRTAAQDDPTVVALPPSEPSNLDPEQQPGPPSRLFLPSIDRDSE